MSKKNRNYGGRDRSNYNKPDPDIAAADVIPSVEEVGDAELNVKDLNATFVPNSLMYNAFGIAPVSTTYRILMKELKEIFTKLCKQQIDGVDCVKAVYDKSIGEVQFFCVFTENCRHFNDQSMKDTMLSDQRPTFYSRELKEFAAKFGLNPQRDCVRDKNGKILGSMAELAKKGKDHLNANVLFVPNLDNANNIVRSYSMRLSWTTLVRLIFDMDGKAFEGQFGRRPSRCKLECHFEFQKTHESEFGNVLYLEVTKSSNGGNYSNTPRPKVSFNYSEA